jgi:KipI family sensor histidine kinase inhibitor
MPLPDLQPYGDSALLAVLGTALDLETNLRVHALAGRLAAAAAPGLGAPVPAYASLLIPYDPLALDAEAARAAVQPHLAWAVGLPGAALEEAAPAAVVDIPTRYGGKDGPDLEAVAARHGTTPEAIIALHTDAVYRVYMLGFAPGFAYMGPLPPELVTPRRPTPRARVPAGSVGLAGAQTGIYPLVTPGGWQIIGRTALALWDATRDPPALLRPGLRVRFVQE